MPSTLTVLNNLDSGAGSLRAEIAAAHNSDTIVFAAGLNGQTITLTSGEVLISHNVTIAGPGSGQLTISGNHASRVFEVKANESVTLSGLTISNGVANGVGVAGEGSGILNHGTLTVSGSTLSGNSARQDGGGIHNDGTLIVSNCTLSNNSAGQGGAIHNEGTLTVSGSILSGNSAYRGGGIENYGTLTVSGSTLSGNSASDGGGIFNGSGTVTVKNSSSITGNTAPVGLGADVNNQGVLYLDISSIIGILDGNPARPI
ncbi:MAG TPA: hypothetical protein VKH44_03840, partial [Pirellulaceae bacterium]|nr:hypothetical protein [Pirellulaceae bacterium]